MPKLTYEKSHPVALAVEPLRVDAVNDAEKKARSRVQRLVDELTAADFNAAVVAPYPDRRESDTLRYQLAKNKYGFLYAICRGDSYFSGQKVIPVRVDQDRVEHYVRMCISEAEAQYEMFVAKLVLKVGTCKTAALTGNHVWSHSYLRVEHEEGEVVIWKTHQIHNVSKLGKVYPQWPSRRVKGVGA